MAVYFDNKPTAYARIEMIRPDIKTHWFQVQLLFLSFPPQETTWILREEYLEGTDFTMNNIPIRVIPLENPWDKHDDTPQTGTGKISTPGEVVSFDKFRKKKE